VAVISSNISTGHPFTRLIEASWVGRDCSDWVGAYAMEKLSWLDPSSPDYGRLTLLVQESIGRKRQEIIGSKPDIIILNHVDSAWIAKVLEDRPIKEKLSSDYVTFSIEGSNEYLIRRDVASR
jgi:hypothetical protein